MQFKGLLAGSISLNGYSPDLLKSGVQKYSRRGELEKCQWCAVELDLFSECGGEPIRTNNINRLIVIAAEEIGVASPTLPILVGKYLRDWETHRQSDGGEDRLALLKTVGLLATSPKIRLPSDIRAVYSHGVEDPSIREDPRFREIYQDLEQLPEAAAGLWEMFHEKDCEELSPLMDGLVYQLDQQSDRAFYYLFQILRLREEKRRCAQRFRGWQPSPGHYSLEKPLGGRFQPEYAIWEHLFQRAESENPDPSNSNFTSSLEVLFDWYCHRSEPWLYLCQAMLMFLRDCQWDLPEEPELSLDQVSQLYQRNQTTKLELDDYVYDRHTQEGRKQGHGPLHFAQVASQVTQEETTLLNSSYREIYQALKLKSETKSKSKSKTMGKPKAKRAKKSSNPCPELLEGTNTELVEDPIPV